MKYNIKTTDLVLTPALSEYTAKRLNNLDRFISPEQLEITLAYVEIGKSTNHHKKGDIFIAEFTVHIGSKVFRAKTQEADLYTAIDIATEDLAEELKSFKDKKKSLIRRTGARLKSFVRGFYDSQS